MWWLVALCVVLDVAGYTDPGWTAKEFVAGQNPPPFGPVGLVFDQENRFFYTDGVCIYRISSVFPWSGTPYTDGSAGTAKICNLVSEGAWIQALAIDGKGRLWTGNPNSGILNQINPDTMQEVASPLVATGSSTGVLGIAEHPVSGDLYWTARYAPGGIYRLNIAAADAITLFSPNFGIGGDGIAFDAAKNIIYAETEGSHVYVVQGPTVGVPPAPSSYLTGACITDGLAVSTDNRYLYVNCNNGEVIQIDKTISDPALNTKTIFNDTYRGDFCVVGPDGCLYITHEPDSIWQLCPHNGITLLPTPTGCVSPYIQPLAGVSFISFTATSPLGLTPTQGVENQTHITFTAILKWTGTAPPGATDVANYAFLQQGNLRNYGCNYGQTFTLTSTTATFLCITTNLPQGSHKYYASWFYNGIGSPLCVSATQSGPLVVNITEIPHKNAGGA